ncbi:hypothetical protein GC209_13175 [bacterium]|nr:hypothetical protein [bacterium]
MKKLLVSTAMLALMTGAGFAQSVPATNHPAPATAQTSVSLLDGLLANASALSASLSNVAQNLNSVDGSINVTTSRDYSGIASGINALSGGGTTPFGSYSQVGTNVYGQDLPAALLGVLDPLTASLGDLSTTSIGAMQSGSITATVDASKIVSSVQDNATASTTSAMASADTYGGIANTLAFQNIAVNSGDINGSVQLALADVNSTVGKVATTAIGAMGSGSLTANITGNMGATTDATSAIVASLVGGSTAP